MARPRRNEGPSFIPGGTQNTHFQDCENALSDAPLPDGGKSFFEAVQKTQGPDRKNGLVTPLDKAKRETEKAKKTYTNDKDDGNSGFDDVDGQTDENGFLIE